MLDKDQALDRLDHVLRKASSFGADAADAVYFGDMSSSVHVRLGEIEDIGRSESEEIGIRVFVGERSANVSSSDLSPEALAAAAERAIAMAREAPEDRFAGLAPSDDLGPSIGRSWRVGQRTVVGVLHELEPVAARSTHPRERATVGQP